MGYSKMYMENTNSEYATNTEKKERGEQIGVSLLIHNKLTVPMNSRE